MRWFVEISPLGASEGQKQKWCLEAAGWQPALKDARAHRGEEGPLGGFSIELLDDGARAVDPATRLRYVIRQAPDDAPLTHTKAGPVSAAPKSEPAKAAPKSEPAKAAPKSEPAKAAEPAPPKSEPAKAAEPAPPKSEPVPASPAATKAAPVEEPAADDVEIPVDDDAEAAPLPNYELLQAREENPSDRSPLTYREYVYAVAPATSDAEIERLLHARFAAVTRDLENAKSGRFVNLAIFDHAFTGKPSKRPRATLAWKDWRGGPEIRFPAAERSSLSPPSFSAPTSFSNPIPAPSVPPGSPVSLVPSTAAAPTQPTPAETAPTELPPAQIAVKEAAPPSAAPTATMTVPPITELATTEPSPAAPAKSEPSSAEAATTKPQGEPAPASPKAEPPASPKAEPPASPKVEPPSEVKIEPAPEPPARPSAAPMSAAPKTKPAAAAPPPPAKREAYIPPVKTAAEVGKRMSGDELISELFEACGDLHFVRDSLDGADFVLGLALEKLPSEIGLVSLFDINRREFVVVRQAGGPKSIVLSRLPERAGLAQPAMRKKAAIVVADASKEPRALDDRFRALGVELHSLIVAPVEVSGRYLGLLELCNPIDGKAFTEGDGHALTYIGEQYAEFVAERGVLLDPETVIERHQKR